MKDDISQTRFKAARKHNFRNLKVYSRAIEFAVDIYRLSKAFPKEELYGLTSQIRRAVTSISLNIAEGSGNSSEKEFRRFLEIALRSDYEVMSCLEIALMIVGFSKSLSSDNRGQKSDIQKRENA